MTKRARTILIRTMVTIAVTAGAVIGGHFLIRAVIAMHTS